MKIIILSFVVTFMVIMLFKSTIDLIDRVKEKSFLYSLIEQCTDCSHDEIITFKKQLSREEQIIFLKSLKYKESYKDGLHGYYNEKTHHIRIFNAYRDDAAIIATTNVINLKDKLIPTSLLKQSCLLSNVVLTIILASSLVFSVSGCFKAIKEKINYAKFFNSVCLTTEEMERK